MDDNLRQRKNELFQELKPHCIKLSQLALKGDGGTASTKDLIDATKQLQDILRDRCEANDAFDDNLANYVFFPLQHVLRLCQKRTGRLAELATRCLRELLEYGWRTIAIQLGHQLLLLLTFFAGGGPSATHVSEELQEEAYRALRALFRIIHNTPRGAASLVEASNVPALGQCLSVILDGINSGPSSQIQLAALTALNSLWSCIKDRQALSSFLPGTVSALTKCLTPTIKSPRSRIVLIGTLQIFQNIITTTLSDVATRNMKDDNGIESNSSLSRSWLTATATQIKLALANIIKLRSHDHQEVRNALETMCLTILDECHYSLAESAPLLVETALSVVTSSGADEDLFRQGLSLRGLAIVYPSVSELIKGTAYKWVISLPRIMQGNDELAKQSALSQISKVQGIFSDIGQNSMLLNDSLFESLRNTIISLLGMPPFRKGVSEIKMAVSINPAISLSSVEKTVNHYRPILMPHGSQTQTQEQLDLLISNISPPEIRIDMARRLMKYMRNSAGIEMLSALWLSLNLLRSRTSMELDSLIQKSQTISDETEAVLSELYACAVSNLESDREGIDTDWRIQAISLEIITYAASIWGDSFQLDLADTIYPIVHLLGSPNAELREHAVASLNTISRSSGYSSTSDMIVSNVDYLVNAIALKLNTFDISPQAPQVLVMMISLSGPSILPYLDDVVVSIFAALDNFHGYPRLVESLFNVLGEIVEQSRVSGQLQVLETPKINHPKQKAIGPRIENVLTIIRANMEKVSATRRALNETFPAEPWKGAGAQLDELETSNSLEETSTSPQGFEVYEPAPTKLYTMVQNIARLSQHYLTNQSPLLRARLLNLIYSANEVLYTDENQYLPLVNDIWPVLIKRLYDDEPFVIIAASRAVEDTCIRAGDFMSTRIEVEWHDILRHARNAKTKATGEKKGSHGRGHHSQNWQVWEAFIKLLITIVEYVRIEDDMFDEALEVLADIVGNREDVRNSFSCVNADAVWLLQLQQGQLAPIKAPVTNDIRFVNVYGRST